MQWQANVGRKAAKYFFHGDPFIGQDRIVASADVDRTAGIEAGLHAFELTTGRELWMYATGRGVLGAVAGGESAAFAYSASGELVALSVQTGELLWTQSINAPAWESPGLVGHRVVAGSSDGTLLGLDATTGRTDWRISLGASVTSSVRTDGSASFVGTSDGVLHRVEAHTGKRLSSLRLDPTLRPSAAPLVASDSVLVLLSDSGADAKAVVSADRGLTAVQWRWQPLGHWSTTRVFASATFALQGTPSGELEAFCLATGKPAWSHKVANAPIRTVGGSDETLFVGTPTGTLLALRLPTAC